MLRRVPVVSTLVVLVAVGIMLRLGFWQLDRLHQKEALLATYAAAQAMSADVPFPQDPAGAQGLLYRHSSVECLRAAGATSKAGRSATGASGLARTVTCSLAGGGKALVVLGWSTAPLTPDWRGGTVQGIIAPGPRLVADPPLAGLAANAKPDPADIPNNHLSYAVQWFLFAATALVIYGLALRKRLRE
jgi:cytochrome oxidase assembly protein ShyY1